MTCDVVALKLAGSSSRGPANSVAEKLEGRVSWYPLWADDQQ